MSDKDKPLSPFAGLCSIALGVGLVCIICWIISSLTGWSFWPVFAVIGGLSMAGGSFVLVGVVGLFIYESIGKVIKFAISESSPHPVQRSLDRAQQRGWREPINATELANALERAPNLRTRLSMALFSKIRAEQAEKATRRLKAETALAQAVIEREKARAEAADWETRANEHERRRRR